MVEVPSPRIATSIRFMVATTLPLVGINGAGLDPKNGAATTGKAQQMNKVNAAIPTIALADSGPICILVLILGLITSDEQSDYMI